MYSGKMIQSHIVAVFGSSEASKHLAQLYQKLMYHHWPPEGKATQLPEKPNPRSLSPPRSHHLLSSQLMYPAQPPTMPLLLRGCSELPAGLSPILLPPTPGPGTEQEGAQPTPIPCLKVKLLDSSASFLGARRGRQSS